MQVVGSLYLHIIIVVWASGYLGVKILKIIAKIFSAKLNNLPARHFDCTKGTPELMTPVLLKSKSNAKNYQKILFLILRYKLFFYQICLRPYCTE